jgi:predicted MFS family arabinose efflux permease
VPWLDELASGLAPASTPEIASSLGLSGGAVAGAMIVAFHSLAFFVEAPLLAWSERVRARWFSAGALAVLAGSAWLAAAVPRGWVFFLALALYGPASGCSLAVAEGLLVESRPAERVRTMARLSLAANAGDLAVPVLLAVLAWFGLGWRAAFAASGAAAMILALAHACERPLDVVPTLAADDDGEDHGQDKPHESPTIVQALRTALSTRALLGWSFACALTGLLDEVLVAFGAVHMQAIGANVTERSAALAAWVVGGFLGLTALERLAPAVRVRTLLLGASALTAAAIGALAITHSPRLAGVAFFVLGLAASTLHPLSKTRAYASLPNRPALVNAVASALLPFDMAAPIVLAVIAARMGSASAIAALLVAPVGVALAGLRLPARDAE